MLGEEDIDILLNEKRDKIIELLKKGDYEESYDILIDFIKLIEFKMVSEKAPKSGDNMRNLMGMMLLTNMHKKISIMPPKESEKQADEIHCIIEDRMVDVKKCEACPTQCNIYRMYKSKIKVGIKK